MYEKRKNGNFPRWILWLALGFVLGVGVSQVLLQPRVSVSNPAIDPDIGLTADAIIQAATAEGSAGGEVVDDFQLTATALMQQATQGVQPLDADNDPLLLTATALIAGATQTANSD